MQSTFSPVYTKCQNCINLTDKRPLLLKYLRTVKKIMIYSPTCPALYTENFIRVSYGFSVTLKPLIGSCAHAYHTPVIASPPPTSPLHLRASINNLSPVISMAAVVRRLLRSPPSFISPRDADDDLSLIMTSIRQRAQSMPKSKREETIIIAENERRRVQIDSPIDENDRVGYVCKHNFPNGRSTFECCS